MAVLKQSTAFTRMFKMIDSADHLSKKTGLTCTVNISKAGGTFGAAGGTVTEVANGWYKVALTTTDTNTLGDLAYYITATGADDTDFADQVTANILGDTLPANMTQVNAHNVTDTASGVLDVNAKNLGGTAQTGRDVGASVLLSAGAGTGQLDFTSGVVKTNLAQILGTALTETAGQIAAAFKKLFDVAVPVLTAVSVNQTGDGFARLGAPAGASVSADVAAVKSDTGAVKTQTDKLAFTVANQVDANVLDWKSATAPAMTGDAFARLGAPAGASVSADVAALKADLDAGVTVATVAASASNIKKNTAKNGLLFVMTDATTHAPKTGLTVTSTRSIDGGAFAATTNAATEVASGTYALNLSAADMNGDHIMLRFTGAGADDLNIEIITQP